MPLNCTYCFNFQTNHYCLLKDLKDTTPGFDILSTYITGDTVSVEGKLFFCVGSTWKEHLDTSGMMPIHSSFEITNTYSKCHIMLSIVLNFIMIPLFNRIYYTPLSQCRIIDSTATFNKCITDSLLPSRVTDIAVPHRRNKRAIFGLIIAGVVGALVGGAVAGGIMCAIFCGSKHIIISYLSQQKQEHGTQLQLLY